MKEQEQEPKQKKQKNKNKTKNDSLSNFGESWGFIKSDKSNAFIENHDNERGHGAGGNVLTFKDGKLYELGYTFMLAWPYGDAQVMSSYQMRNTDHSAPANAVWQSGRNTCFDSGSQWVCQHRWYPITAMVPFRAATRGEPVANWWSNGKLFLFLLLLLFLLGLNVGLFCLFVCLNRQRPDCLQPRDQGLRGHQS